MALRGWYTFTTPEQASIYIFRFTSVLLCWQKNQESDRFSHMEDFMDLISIVTKTQEVAGLASLVLTGLIGLAMLIPGEQPEKALQKVLDIVKRFSRK